MDNFIIPLILFWFIIMANLIRFDLSEKQLDGYFDNITKTFGTLKKPKGAAASLPDAISLQPQLTCIRSQIKEVVYRSLDRIVTHSQQIAELNKLAKDVKEIFPYICEYGELVKKDTSVKANVACLLLLVASVANNTLFHYEQLPNREYQAAQASTILETLNTVYNIADLRCEEGINNDPTLFNLRKRIFECLRCWEPDNMSNEELDFHIQRKNANSKTFNNPFNGFLINNLEGYHTNIIDEVCLQKITDQIALIVAGKKPRTQFIVRIYGSTGHGLVIDVSYNADRKKLEIICVDPTTVRSQWNVINELTKRLHIDYEILAIQAKLQKNFVGCLTFCIALSSELSKTSFSQLNKNKPVDPKTIVFREPEYANSYQPIKNVKWIPVTALGKKAITMAQSTTEMEQHLTALFNKKQAQEIVSESALLYGFDHDQQKTYYDHRRTSLKLKFEQQSFADLSVEKVLSKLKNNPSEHVPIDLALRRLAAGLRPIRELHYLLTVLENEGKLDQLNVRGGKDEKTPLHWAIEKGKLKRAQLLLSKKAKSDIPDKKGESAKDYFAKTSHQELRANPYLFGELL